jgi:hypothetical protein
VSGRLADGRPVSDSWSQLIMMLHDEVVFDVVDDPGRIEQLMGRLTRYPAPAPVDIRKFLLPWPSEDESW